MSSFAAFGLGPCIFSKPMIGCNKNLKVPIDGSTLFRTNKRCSEKYKKKKEQRIPRKVKKDPEGNTNQDKNSYIGNVAKRP